VKKIILPVTIFLGVFLFLLFTTSIPFSGSEIRESYTAYSLIKTNKDTNGVAFPLIFKADGNYLSTIGVYSKVLFVSIFGLDTLGVRSFGAVAGILSILSLYIFLKAFTKNDRYSFWGTVFFSFSPLLIKSSFLNPTPLIYLSIFLLLIKECISLKEKKKKIFVKAIIISLCVIVVGLFMFQPNYLRSVARSSMIEELLPSSYSFEIDKRLSFGQIYNSPLYTTKINLNRIVLNKVYYFSNAFLKSLIYPFNFEKIFSPMQAQTLLAKDNFDSKTLPSLFFWELPIIIAGYIVLSKKQKGLTFILGLCFGIEIFLKGNLIFLLPIIALSEGVFFVTIVDRYSKHRKYIYLFISVLVLGSNFIFLGLMKNHFVDWVPGNDLYQNKIWENISKKDIVENKIFVTDRFGEPVFYFLFYEKIEPDYYLNNHKNGALLDGYIQRVDSVGNVTFKSFDFSKITHSPNELWVGLGGEFAGENNEYSEIKGIENGEIIKKITGVDSQSSRFFGTELWFVKTKIKVAP